MHSTKPVFIIGLAVLLSIPAFGAAGKKCLFIGNSLTDEVYGTQDIAASEGYTNCTWGRHMTPGTPLWLLWKDEAMKRVEYYHFNAEYGTVLSGSLTDVLKDTAWDVVTLQVYPMNGDGLTSSEISAVTAARGFAAAAYQGNPNCQIYIYESHPVYKDYPTPSAASRNPPYMSNDTNMYRPIADSLRSYFPHNPPALVVPANPVWHRLRLLAQAGNAPGLSSYLDLYAADSGHSNANGRYLLATLFYATIYKQDPHGIMNTGFKHLGWTNGVAWNVSATFANTAQEVVWQTLQEYPYAGVRGTEVRQPSSWKIVPINHDIGRSPRCFTLDGRRVEIAANRPVGLSIVHGEARLTGIHRPVLR